MFRLEKEIKTLDFDLSNKASFVKESLVLRDLKAPFDHINLHILGSCNGLVAARDFAGGEESLFIWNPATGFFKKLPSRRKVNVHDLIYGFGYASRSDEYKLVMDAEIFSSKTNSWKPIELPSETFGMSEGVLCRGALFWHVYDIYPDVYMHAFDLEREEFSMMKLPSALYTQWNSMMRDFGVTCEGGLFVLAESPVQDCGSVVEFWVMRKYGNSDSWTRSFSLKYPTQPERRDVSIRVGAISDMETSAFLWTVCPGEEKLMSTIYLCNKEENTVIYTIESDLMDAYEESLCCLA